jgi:hypothetical protein
MQLSNIRVSFLTNRFPAIRPVAIIATLALSSATGFAQYTAGSAPHSYTAGNVLYPGGVPPTPPIGSAILPMGGYGQSYSSGHGSGGRGSGGSHARFAHPAHAAGVIVPVYLGGGGGYYYGDPQQQQSQQQQPAALEGQDPAVVIVNQDYRPEYLNPVVHDYTNVAIPESPPIEQRQSTPPPATIQQAQDQSPTIYLIAMKDGNIVAALGYWMEGDTLNYITRDANRNRVSIDRVDREFSAKLNADRNIEFKLE